MGFQPNERNNKMWTENLEWEPDGFWKGWVKHDSFPFFLLACVVIVVTIALMMKGF